MATLKGQPNLKRLDEGAGGVVDADDAEQHAEEDDETVVRDGAPVESGPLELQVEVARPDEREHGAREAADEAHEDSEVRDRYGHDYSEHDEAHSDGEAPHFELAVERPHSREHRFRSTFEQCPLQKIQSGVIRQWIRKQGLPSFKSSITA